MVPVLLAKLDGQSSEFISSLINKGEQKSKLVSVALAKALADKLELPDCDDEIDSINIYFAREHKEKVMTSVLGINELVSLNKEEVLEYIKAIYGYRYSQACPTDIVPYINKETALEDFFGISKFFSTDFTEVIKEHGSNITSYVNKFNVLISKLD